MANLLAGIPLVGLAKHLHAPLMVAAMWLLAVGSAQVGTRALNRRLARKRTEALQELFARITAHLQSSLVQPVRVRG